MGFLSYFRFKKLKREEVVNSIIKLEKEQEAIEDGIVEKTAEIEELLKKGKAEKSQEIRLLYAKKINYLKAQKQRDAQRGMYLVYNINLMNKLKDAMEDKEFYANTGKIPINKLLGDQKALAKYLNKALNLRVKEEDILTTSDDTFNEVAMQYDLNETIYGAGKNDDQLLAMFEEQDTAEQEETIAAVEESGEAGLIEKEFEETDE